MDNLIEGETTFDAERDSVRRKLLSSGVDVGKIVAAIKAQRERGNMYIALNPVDLAHYPWAESADHKTISVDDLIAFARTL